ncbi:MULTISPECIES: acetyltransferase [unclassified Clostridioides]|uniref:acetyltransferase n=1 Tax=unclassified Clostridioides TaxID=2635829 RepID=UPI001D129E4B|nr:acetyltransferase [Clostridioides sp. ZZV15-6388]MCC0661941.1 acetyltransferase [Clostridioides sp. ZZV14-6154]MCC0663044.1 acetyltransferase [Clostridioides sp. ZZV15-6597]MCC0670016.1 acetyltransferase [Clostridioides sp. ZZV14-6153]MCC0719195.1 acetyltransferase [Clostridioides sp. ZZV14-6105]
MSSEIVFEMKQRSAKEFQEMLQVWESSVRATHDFLIEKDIESLKPLVKIGLTQVETMVCVKDDNMIKAFMGIDKDKIEMLFIKGEYRSNGIGKKLILYAINKYNIKYVDVNEQNKKAVGFYTHLGFKEFDRSEIDGQGNPYPILHMKLG